MAQQTAAFLVDNYLKTANHQNHQRATESCRFVYLFRNPTVNLCKIGITNSWYSRMRHIENSIGMKVQDLIVLEVEPETDESSKSIEKYLHNYFKDKRKEGEWFDLSIRDILAIKNLFWEIYGMNIDDNVKQHLSNRKQAV